MKNNYFSTLDGIRGLAALLVILRHTTKYFGNISFQESYLAVDIFFVLSGVVIANAYEEKLRTNLTLKQFIQLRLARLFPLYILGGIISIFAITTEIRSDIKPDTLICLSFLYIFMFPNFFRIGNEQPYPLNNPTWSLFFELIVNFLYAASVSYLTRIRLVAIIVTSGLCVTICEFIRKDHNLDFGWSINSLPAGLFLSIYSFFIGTYIYKIYSSNSLKISHDQNSILRILGILIALFLTLILSPNMLLRPYYDLFAVIFLFPFLIYLSLYIKLGYKAESICKFLGILSYGLYVLHQPIALLLQGFLLKYFDILVANYAPIIGFVLILMLITLTWVIDKFYDMPVRNYLVEKIIGKK